MHYGRDNISAVTSVMHYGRDNISTVTSVMHYGCDNISAVTSVMHYGRDRSYIVMSVMHKNVQKKKRCMNSGNLDLVLPMAPRVRSANSPIVFFCNWLTQTLTLDLGHRAKTKCNEGPNLTATRFTAMRFLRYNSPGLHFQ